MSKTNDYWSNRLANATWNSYNNTNKYHKELVELYREATEEIMAELYKIDSKFAEDGIISRSKFYRAEHLKRMRDGFDSILKELGEEVESGGSLAIIEAGKKAIGVTGNILKDAGIDLNYDKELAKRMLQKPWHGATFSDRVWKNTNKLSRELNSTVRKGIMTGKSTASMAMELSRTMDSKLYEASRLVRSETMHHLNEVNKASMKNSGMKQVQEIVTLDERTSSQCAPHNKLVHDIDKAPILPRHPNCRCVLVAYIDVDKMAEEFDRKEKEILGSEVVAEVRLNDKTLNVIKRKYGNVIGNTVALRRERLDHIIKGHSDIGGNLVNTITNTVKNSDYILNDYKNELTSLFVKTSEVGIVVVVKFSISKDRYNSIMTAYRVSEKNLKRILKKYEVIYKK